MKCPHCDFVQSDRKGRCLKCGIIFEQYRTSVLRKRTPISVAESTAEESTFLQDVLFSVEPKVNPFYFGGRMIIFAVALVWGWKFILGSIASNDAGSSFLHLVNLPFHEAGHVLFQPLGRWMTSLGGTLGQLLIPALCLLVFLVKTKDPFGASISLWWLGESFIDIAPYINDARNQELMLLGGVTGKEADYGFHDWEFILHEIGLLRFDHALAHVAHMVGMALMLLSFAWAGYVLHRQFKHLDWV